MSFGSTYIKVNSESIKVIQIVLVISVLTVPVKYRCHLKANFTAVMKTESMSHITLLQFSQS